MASTVCYHLATALTSLSVYDYWDPAGAVSRIVTGAGVDMFQITVKGDVHELTFSGPAADLLDSYSGAFGVSGALSFPAEPPVSEFDYSIVPGQLSLARFTVEPSFHLDRSGDRNQEQPPCQKS